MYSGFLRDFSGDLTAIFRLAYGAHGKALSIWYQRYLTKSTLFLFTLLYRKRGINTRGLRRVSKSLQHRYADKASAKNARLAIVTQLCD